MNSILNCGKLGLNKLPAIPPGCQQIASKSLLIFPLLVLLMVMSRAAEAKTVTASPTTCTSVAGIGTVAWTNPGRAVASDASYATASVDGTTTRFLQCTGYGFAIPASATINGITVNVTRRSNSTANGGSDDAAMRLVKAGVIGATDASTATVYTTADVIEAHGGATYLWGTTWTPADINAANFGAAFAATKASASGAAHTISVDYIQISVDYTVPFSCTPPSNVPAGVTVSCQCDNFERATLNPSTIFNSNWSVSTSDATGIVPSIVNSGFLRLTNNTGNNAKAATVPGIFPAAGNYISVEFQQYAYNGTGADGIAVILSDYSVPAVPGAYGGSLGYAQETGIHDGFAGGWLGVGLDEYGNYQNTNEGRIGGQGFIVQSVGARGSGSGQTDYRWLGGTGVLSPTIDNRTSTSASYGYYYQVVVDARNDPTSTSIVVRRDTGGGYADLINIPNVYTAATAQGFTQAPVPTNWQISFTGSTGGSTNIHEISGLRICASTVVPPSGGVAGSFNAVDEATGTPPSVAVQSYLNGHIFTKLVGTPFRLNVAALANSQIVTTYAAGGVKNVDVKLVDNSDSLTNSALDCTLSCTPTCTGKTAVTGGSQTLTFAAGATDLGQKQTANFTLNSAYQKLVAIISDGTTTACSTDSFSVRPLSITTVASIDTPTGAGNAATNAGSAGNPFFKAGSGNFALTATTAGVAGSPSGYNGVMKINSAVITSTATYAGYVTGSFPAATIGTPSSTATGTTFTYSEVGGFTLPGYPVTNTTSRRGVYDGVTTLDECTTPGLTPAQCEALKPATWTGVDSVSTKNDCVMDSYSNTKATTPATDVGKYGCNFGLVTTTAVIGRFVPDHFAVTANMIVNRAEYGITGSVSAGSGALTLSSAAGVQVGDVISIAGAGAAGATLTTTAASVSTNGLTVTLAVNATTTVTNSLVNVAAFTYMGEQMKAMFTLTAQSAGGTTTRNYAGTTWAKLDPTVAGALNMGAIDNPVAPGVRMPLITTGLSAVTGQFLATCTSSPACLGTANVIAPFTIDRGTTGEGPYRALDIGIAPVDSDGVTTSYDLDTVRVVAGANNHTKVGRTEVRYGRIKVSNAYGSELLPLTLMASAQYFTSTGWVNSINDYLTDITLAATYPLLDKNGNPTGSTTSASRSPASGFLAGQLTIKLAKPAGSGTVTGIATINPTNNPVAASAYLPISKGTATFGVYKGAKEFIYMREAY
jgi:MSHA biogenesis protein MshQ